MTRTVVALGGGAAFKDIVRTMKQWRVRALPVLDGEGRVIGVVSEADLLRKEEFRDDDLSSSLSDALRHHSDRDKAAAVTAAELMTTPALTVHVGDTLARVARDMARHKVERLPVVDDAGALKGIVSRSGLLKVFLRDDEDIAEEIRREVIGGRFPVSPESVRVQARDGVVALTGYVPDTTPVPLAVRPARSMEGVVDVHWTVAGPRRPALDPDFLEEDEESLRTW
ncbi:CBS domain-containing protein [Streptomyces atrovirens]|uniref:CBS domain-containing protein n=1 Tax=Streptomyces atrovirens TaxID=285556 RepID=A0ABW0DWQ5_9ACTN